MRRPGSSSSVRPGMYPSHAVNSPSTLASTSGSGPRHRRVTATKHPCVEHGGGRREKVGDLLKIVGARLGHGIVLPVL
jgi:hypothetical protein